MTQDWFDSPNTSQKPQMGGLLRYVWASICSGTGAGMLGAIGLVLYNLLLENFGNVNPNRSVEDSPALVPFILVVFGGGGLGLLYGAPAALIFGGLGIRVSRKLTRRMRIVFGLIFGAISGAVPYLLLSLIAGGDFSLGYEELQYVSFFSLMGLIGAAIFIFIMRKHVLEEQTQ